MATFMPPWLDWLDWLKWDCIGAGALGKILGVWFGFLHFDCPKIFSLDAHGY